MEILNNNPINYIKYKMYGGGGGVILSQGSNFIFLLHKL